jgi:HlyD family secretion protein
LLAALALVTVLGWTGLQRMNGQAASAGQQIQYVTVERRSISSSVSASGSIEPEADVTLTFGTMGRLVKLLVHEGDRVEAGQVLAVLDTAELEFQVAQVEAGLVAAQAQLAQLQSLPRLEDVAAAQAVVAAARANLDDLQARKKDSTAQVKPSDHQIDAARAQLDQAQAALEKVLQGVSPAELVSARAQVSQAVAQLEQAHTRLSSATLKAPFAGTVTAVNAQVGTLVTQQVPVIGLADLSQFHVTVNIDQAEIGRIQVGQPAIITIDAFRDQPLAGRVAFIAPAATTQSGGVVSYRVRIDIDPTDLPLRTGLTTNVAITTEARDAALVVPNRAIELDRESGKAYVVKLVDGQPTRVEIETGIRNETLSEVVRGLAEGDRVALRPGAVANFADLFYLPGETGKPKER